MLNLFASAERKESDHATRIGLPRLVWVRLEHRHWDSRRIGFGERQGFARQSRERDVLWQNLEYEHGITC